MNIDFIAKIAGVLGFFISVTTFVLTRWERRSRLSFGMDRNHVTTGKIPDNLDEDDESFEAVSLRISNVGPTAVVLDLRTIVLESNGCAMHIWRGSVFNNEQREVLLKPNESIVIHVFLENFIESLKFPSPARYDSESFNRMYPILISVSTVEGRNFKDKKIKYWEATGEFHRK